MQKRKTQPTCSNNTVLDIDTRGRANVESISIWASRRSHHFDARYHNPKRISECNVCSLTINQRNISYSQLLAPVEDYSLQHNYFSKFNPEKEKIITKCIYPRTTRPNRRSMFAWLHQRIKQDQECFRQQILRSIKSTKTWKYRFMDRRWKHNTFVALILQD